MTSRSRVAESRRERRAGLGGRSHAPEPPPASLAATRAPDGSSAAGELPAVVASVPRLALSPNEAAAALGVSRDYFDDHIAHELRWVRRGRRKFVSVAELERWLERSSALTVNPRRQLPSEER